MVNGCHKSCAHCRYVFRATHNRVKFCSLRCAFLSQVRIVRGTCWEWLGWVDDAGYGVIYFGGKTIKAHRASFELFKGPLRGKCSLHHCDNTGCTNPDHLFKGTQTDNVLDMDRKGRRRVGTLERQSCAKLNRRQVRRIRERLARGDLCAEIARQYGVVFQTISNIKYAKSWRELP